MISNDLATPAILPVAAENQALQQLKAKKAAGQQPLQHTDNPANPAGISAVLPGKKGDTATPAATMSGYVATDKDTVVKTRTDAQAIGQEEGYDDNVVVQEFLSYMQKSPAERYFDKMLKALGLTKEEYEALPPEEKTRIMEKIEAMKEEEARQRSEGLDPDLL